jgi:hypothetical protein
MENIVSQFVGLFTAPMPRNGGPIVPRYASAGMYLAARCLAMGVARTTYKTLLAIPFLLLLARISGVAQKWVHMSQCDKQLSSSYLYGVICSWKRVSNLNNYKFMI